MRALALRFKIRHYLPGHFIIKQGDEVKRLYFIAKGNIEVVKFDETMLTLGWYLKSSSKECGVAKRVNLFVTNKSNTFKLIFFQPVRHSAFTCLPRLACFPALGFPRHVFASSSDWLKCNVLNAFVVSADIYTIDVITLHLAGLREIH